MNPVHTSPSSLSNIDPNIILSSTSRSSWLFPAGFGTETLFLFSLIRATRLAYLILLDFLIPSRCNPFLSSDTKSEYRFGSNLYRFSGSDKNLDTAMRMTAYWIIMLHEKCGGGDQNSRITIKISVPSDVVCDISQLIPQGRVIPKKQVLFSLSRRPSPLI
jgi:hypothetical protein